jgi:hypothetical protein
MDPHTHPEKILNPEFTKGFAPRGTCRWHIFPINRIDNSLCFESVGICIAGPQWVELLVL